MSTIKVDTYLTRGGASEIAIDKLKGVSAVGSIIITDTNGNVTTNIQEGLTKYWVNYDAPNQAVDGSFSSTSVTDSATGQSQEITKGITRKALPKPRKVKVPREYQGGKKPGRFSQLYKDTFGKLIKPFGAE